jgi:ribonucleotide monophosphatase NagD (HAD superfamily)
MASILMLTGVTTREMAEALPEAERPTRIAADAAELAAALVELAAEG